MLEAASAKPKKIEQPPVAVRESPAKSTKAIEKEISEKEALITHLEIELQKLQSDLLEAIHEKQNTKIEEFSKMVAEKQKQIEQLYGDLENLLSKGS